jgi:hypothetical protein
MQAPYSDFDVMFRPQAREAIVEHLNRLGIQFEVNQVGAIQFRLSMVEHQRFTAPQWIELNFCFVEDFDAWKAATETMKVLSDTLGTEFFTPMSKGKRLHLFSALVEQNGGSKPTIMNSF